MNTQRIAIIFSVIVVAAGVIIRLATDSTQFCRTIPGDAAWPAKTDWDALNTTVDGKLISTIPLAAPCHYSFVGGDGRNASVYDQNVCDALRSNWFSATTHLPSASSPMSYQFTNNTCNPFLGPDVPCTSGYFVSYTVNATTVPHIQTALQFARQHNIRIVIRNSGHDYLGKSTGAHALAIWTQHLKSIDLIPQYQDPSSDYGGPALKVGAGVQGGEIYRFANQHGLMVVAGNCPNVGITAMSRNQGS